MHAPVLSQYKIISMITTRMVSLNFLSKSIKNLKFEQNISEKTRVREITFQNIGLQNNITIQITVLVQKRFH